MLLITEGAIFLFLLVGQLAARSLCPFTAQRANTRSDEFLEEPRGRWMAQPRQTWERWPQPGEDMAASSTRPVLMKGGLCRFLFKSWALGCLMKPP